LQKAAPAGLRIQTAEATLGPRVGKALNSDQRELGGEEYEQIYPVDDSVHTVAGL